MSMEYSEKSIIEALKQASKEVTDDCQMAGVLTAGANILGISEDSVNELISEPIDKDDVKYIDFATAKKLWNDYAICFEYNDGSDVMCQDSGWTLKDAENNQDYGRFFVEKPLIGRWSVTANPIAGEMFYAVYRLRDITKIDGGGNRELATWYMREKKTCEIVANELNIRGRLDLDEAKAWAKDFIDSYKGFEPWEVLPIGEGPDRIYNVVRCDGCDDEDILMSGRCKDVCQKIADELNTQLIADRTTALEIAKNICTSDEWSDVVKKGVSFLDDQCKMVDFFMLSRADFMNEYRYLDEDDYDQTCYDILARSGYENVDSIDPSAMTAREILPIIDAIQKQEWLLSRNPKGGEKNA